MKKHHFKAIIFDLDGTLLNTLNDLGRSMNNVLFACGFPIHPLDDYRYFVGEGIAQLVNKALPQTVNTDTVIIEKCLRLMQQEYTQNWQKTTRPYPGIIETITTIKKNGLPCAVLSNKPHPLTTININTFFDSALFDIVYGAKPDVPRKPDPTAALSIADQFKINPRQIVFCGDSKIDMQTAKAAGMFAVGVLWGFRTQKELIENGADTIITQPQELLEILTIR